MNKDDPATPNPNPSPERNNQKVIKIKKTKKKKKNSASRSTTDTSSVSEVDSVPLLMVERNEPPKEEFYDAHDESFHSMPGKNVMGPKPVAHGAPMLAHSEHGRSPKEPRETPAAATSQAQSVDAAGKNPVMHKPVTDPN